MLVFVSVPYLRGNNVNAAGLLSIDVEGQIYLSLASAV